MKDLLRFIASPRSDRDQSQSRLRSQLPANHAFDLPTLSSNRIVQRTNQRRLCSITNTREAFFTMPFWRRPPPNRADRHRQAMDLLSDWQNGPRMGNFFHKEDRTETHDLRISLERPVWRPRNCPYGGHSADPTRMEKYRESAKPAARPPKPPASTRNEGCFADIRRRHPSVQKLLVRLHVISRCNVAKTRIGDGLGEVSRAPVHGTRL